MNTKSNLRLWQAIDDAENKLLAIEGKTGECFNDEDYNAARIRAIRDWLVPEEEPLDPIWFASLVEYNYDFRKQLRALLTSEADRAEHHND
jgi:hypothetical protein